MNKLHISMLALCISGTIFGMHSNPELILSRATHPDTLRAEQLEEVVAAQQTALNAQDALRDAQQQLAESQAAAAERERQLTAQLIAEQQATTDTHARGNVKTVLGVVGGLGAGALLMMWWKSGDNAAIDEASAQTIAAELDKNLTNRVDDIENKLGEFGPLFSQWLQDFLFKNNFSEYRSGSTELLEVAADAFGQ